VVFLSRRRFMAGLAAGALSATAAARTLGAKADAKPNIIFIMADDQGWADLGCYGSKHILTPTLDRMAAEGMRFTDAYTGSPVCGPARCMLMTGLHAGHATRRGNTATALQKTFSGRPLVPLKADDVTVATLLKRAGYATGMMGKWGIGNPGTTGTPEKHGFDYYLAYLDQVHAHDYYTDYLLCNGKRVELEGNKGGKKEQYTHDLFAADALRFIREHKDRPFFLYLPYTLPHGKYVVPDDAPYSGKSWPQPIKNYAAMITRMDEDIGEMFALLKELGLDEKTIVFFTSDNGPNPPHVKALDSNGPFKGGKRLLYEGGIRAPLIVRWPGKVPAGKVTAFQTAFYDFPATAADLAGAAPPAKTDGLSILPTLLGQTQTPRPFLYWEFFSPCQQAVRVGDWKALRRGTEDPMQLYDLAKDLGETTNVASQHPDVVKKMAAIMAREHTDNKYWPLVQHARGSKK